MSHFICKGAKLLLALKIWQLFGWGRKVRGVQADDLAGGLFFALVDTLLGNQQKYDDCQFSIIYLIYCCCSVDWVISHDDVLLEVLRNFAEKMVTWSTKLRRFCGWRI
jgi:hypothetical protein